MNYDLPLWRPPSEGRSLILQVTLGCSHNQCAFCHMYVGKRFRVRPFDAVRADLEEATRYARGTRRVFLADGDPLAVGAAHLERVCQACFAAFPRLERVSTYATPQNLLRKSPDQLRRIREAGLSLLYLGVESGDDAVLRDVHKGATADEIAAAAERAHAAGFALSCTVLLGLAGRAGSARHAEATGRLLSRIGPAYASALSIMVPEAPHTPEATLRTVPADSPWHEMEPLELVAELRTLVEHLRCEDTTFRSNHASNFLPIGGHLPEDHAALLALIDTVLAAGREDLLRPAWMRGL